MDLSAAAKEYCETRWGEVPFDLSQSDPEFSVLFANFAFDEVIQETRLDEKTRFLAILATLMGCQGTEAFCDLVPAALKSGMSPVELKELIYQGAAYLGLGRMLPLLRAVNRTLAQQGVSLPLPPQATTAPEARIEAGNQVQVDIFGEQMRGYQNSGPEETRHINRWLAGNCFGDYYTRGGLDNRQRELVTFCILAAQGGCEPQLVSHAAGNLNVGNDKALLIDVVSQCLPYMGYPRSLNALRCIHEAAKSQERN